MSQQHQFTGKMQQAFSHYANDPTRSKVKAYRSAYNCSRMSVCAVSVEADRLFKHPIMAQLVEQLNDEVIERAAVDATYVAQRLQLLAEFNIGKFLIEQSDGTAVYDFSNATADDWYCIDEYTTETVLRGRGEDRYEVEKIKIKPAAKLKALELLGRITSVDAFKPATRNDGPADKQTELVEALATLAEKLPS